MYEIGFKNIKISPPLHSKIQEAWENVFSAVRVHTLETKAIMTDSIVILESLRPQQTTTITVDNLNATITTVTDGYLRTLFDKVYHAPTSSRVNLPLREQVVLGNIKLTPLGSLLQEVGAELKKLVDESSYVSGEVKLHRGMAMKRSGIDLENMPVDILLHAVNHVDTQAVLSAINNTG